MLWLNWLLGICPISSDGSARLDGLLVIQSGSWLDEHSLGSFLSLSLSKNKVGKVPTPSGKALHFLIATKDPKVKADCMGLISLAGSQSIS